MIFFQFYFAVVAGNTVQGLEADVKRKNFIQYADRVDVMAEKKPDGKKIIANNKKAYHIPPSSAVYQYRIGGQICERIVSAWIDWQFPQAEGVAVNITDQPR